LGNNFNWLFSGTVQPDIPYVQSLFVNAHPLQQVVIRCKARIRIH